MFEALQGVRVGRMYLFKDLGENGEVRVWTVGKYEYCIWFKAH